MIKTLKLIQKKLMVESELRQRMFGYLSSKESFMNEDTHLGERGIGRFVSMI